MTGKFEKISANPEAAKHKCSAFKLNMFLTDEFINGGMMSKCKYAKKEGIQSIKSAL
jgi:hypothetical protein